MQDLVGIRVADAAEQPGIRERTLERVVFGAKDCAESLERSVEDLNASLRKGPEGIFAADDMDRSPFFCRCLGEEQRSVVEIECGKPDLAGHLCAGLLPMKTTRDHQMDDEENGPVEFPHDLLSDSSQSPHNLAFDSRGRGVDGPQDKRAEEADPLQSAFDDTRAERFEIQ